MAQPRGQGTTKFSDSDQTLLASAPPRVESMVLLQTTLHLSVSAMQATVGDLHTVCIYVAEIIISCYSVLNTVTPQ